MVIIRKSISISFFQFSISATIIAARISALNFLEFGPYYSENKGFIICIHRESDLDVFV